jgi:hypothetical protein
MSYKCCFGCTTYNPSCDGCDTATSSTNPYEFPSKDSDRRKAGIVGKTLDEWYEQESSDE